VESGDQVAGTKDTYEVEHAVGEGGFGITYRARRASNGEVVALKQMRLEKVDSWKALELFEREASVLSSLGHPAIPHYVEFFATTPDGPVAHTGEGTHAPDSLILVQRFVDGEDLGRRLADGRSFEADELLGIIRRVLGALAYLHELNPPVIHRDVNPRNIVVDDDGAAFLVDFGAIQHRLQEKTVGGSTTVGTLGYIPMEQSLGKARPASDIYALAVTTTVLMTGMRPEELPLDDATGKIDLGRLGLTTEADASEAKRRLCAFIDVGLEPIVGQRLGSARAAIEILEGNDAIAVRPDDAVGEPTTPSWKKTLFTLFLGGSLGGAGIIYPLNFDNFSETQMVQMAPFWVLPAAFGFFGLLMQHTKRPILNAIGATIAAGLGLVFFLFAIFPAL
jgi:serine/threonine protein kinase